MTSTPRPWTWEKEPNGMTFGIWHDDDTNIGEVLDADDAAVIVQAVNAHDDLVAALKQSLAEWDASEGQTVSCLAMDTARDALAKASQS